MGSWASGCLEGTADPREGSPRRPPSARSCSCFLELLSKWKMPFHSQFKFQLMEEEAVRCK